MIGPRTRIGEFCVIEQDVGIGADCVVEPYVFIKRWTTLGDRNEISAGTVLGTDPLDKDFRGDRSYLKIGAGNETSRTLHNLARHQAGVGYNHRRWKLHHDIGAHSAQLHDRQ